MKEKGSSFSGSIGFVLAAAGSVVGVGNILEISRMACFDLSCARIDLGFVLLTTDVAIGRKTKKMH